MSKVFVLDTNKQPLDPVHPARARYLLDSRQAAVWRLAPFTIILRAVRSNAPPVPLRIKIDPGSRTTGIALLDDAAGEVVFAAELHHRGPAIKKALETRRAVRRSRRTRKTRHRASRFSNRRRPAGWLPPSLMSRVANVLTWVHRLRKLAPVTALSMELARFDTQRMQDAEIRGVEYQQGTLAGYEVREYLLEKWGRACAYCGATGVPLEIEHIVPRSRGGSNRVSNLTLGCHDCNVRKGKMTAAEFGFPQINAQAKAPLRDAAAVNSTRPTLYARMLATGLPIETGSGGLTKFNRTCRALPKTHWLDAACVGESTPAVLGIAGVRVLDIKATGHGNRQMCGTNKYGFPTRHRTRCKQHYGFVTGDLVRAVVPAGKYAGVYVGRVAVRASGSCRVGSCDGISHKHLRLLQRLDGYSYSLQAGAAPEPDCTPPAPAPAR